MLADIIIITKTDMVRKEKLQEIIEKIKNISSGKIILSKFVLNFENGKMKKGKAIIIEDGPSSTHGNIKIGAGKIAAEILGIKTINPKNYCKGIIKREIEKYGLDFIPAIGYNKKQMKELKESIKNCEKKCDFFIISTQASIEKMLKIKKYIRVSYNLDEGSKNLLRKEIKVKMKDF
jgi:predicted GTPase